MKNLHDLLAAARQTPPEKVSAETRADFARATVAQWKRQPAAATATVDIWKLWERTGLCSLGAATALVICIATFRPAPAPATTKENPFDVVFAQTETPTLF